MGLFSPSEGTPANRLRPSARASARTRSSAPISARLRSRNCRSQSMLYANVWKEWLCLGVWFWLACVGVHPY